MLLKSAFEFDPGWPDYCMGMNLRENEPLCRHTTLRTGGPARFFIEATTENELREAVTFAKTRGLPLFVLGGGSNVLAGDEGFGGAVIKIATRWGDVDGTTVDAMSRLDGPGRTSAPCEGSPPTWVLVSRRTWPAP